MAGFETEFHATLDELCDFIEEWLDEHPIVISAFAFPPRSRVAISRETVRKVLARPDLLQVTFTHGPVDPSRISPSEVADDEHSFLYLLIGRLRPDGLEQSSLTSGYDDPIWKKINRGLKRRTTAGAVYTNEDTGASHFYRNPRFTAGAKALYASGTPLRASHNTGTNYQPK
jgi:hypothetical protein